jgi:hypothetical protein
MTGQLNLLRSNQRCTTHGILHAGFRGLPAFVALKKDRCKLIGNHLVIPHDTIPSNDECNTGVFTLGDAYRSLGYNASVVKGMRWYTNYNNCLNMLKVEIEANRPVEYQSCHPFAVRHMQQTTQAKSLPKFTARASLPVPRPRTVGNSCPFLINIVLI